MSTQFAYKILSRLRLMKVPKIKQISKNSSFGRFMEFRHIAEVTKPIKYSYVRMFSCLTLSVNFWDRHRAKLYLQIDCQSGYLMMLILNGICQYDRKYAVLNKNICHFLEPSPSAFSGKNSKAQEHIQMMQRYALDFLSAKRAR